MVGLPSRSTIQLFGIGFPSWFAAYTLPPATVLIAMSSKIGWCFPAGTLYENGFVPRTAVFEPGAATLGISLPIAIPIMSFRAAIVGYTPTAPKWHELKTPQYAIPVSRAFSMAVSIANVPATCPSVEFPSINANEGPSLTICGSTSLRHPPARIRVV